MNRLLSRSISAAIVLALKLQMPGIGQEPNPVRWTLHRPPPNLSGIAASPDRVVAVGDRGTVLSSADGREWVAESAPSATNLNDVAYTGREFIAVGAAGTVLRSEDGRSWNAQTSGVTFDLRGISAEGKRAIIVGAGNRILTSDDALHWVVREGTVPAGVSSSPLWSVAQGNGVVVAAGQGGALFVSTNLATVGETEAAAWERVNTRTALDLFGVRFLEDRFVVVGMRGTVFGSTNGLAWTNRIPGTPLLPTSDSEFWDAIHVGDGIALLGGPGTAAASHTRVASSVRGGAWVETTPPGTTLRAVARFRGEWLAVGTAGCLMRSTDGLQWEASEAGPTSRLVSAVHLEGAWHLGGIVVTGRFDNASLLIQPELTEAVRSSDWLKWRPLDLNSERVMTAAAEGNGIRVAVGARGGIWTSSNGQDWEAVSTGTEARFTEVRFGGGWFVAVGVETGGSAAHGILLASPDGRHWERPALPGSGPLVRLAYGNGVFVATGPTLLLVSTDARLWSREIPSPDDTQGFLGLAHGNGLFVGLGALTMGTSTDGRSWRMFPKPSTNLLDVAYGGGHFVGVGLKGTVARSLDATNWVRETVPTTLALRRVVFAGDHCLAVGDTATVLEGAGFPPVEPRILVGPAAVVDGAGARMELRVAAASSLPLMYQWSKDGVPIPGATNDVLRRVGAEPADSGHYHVTAANALGSVTSESAEVRIEPPAPATHWEVVSYPGTRVGLDRLARGQGRFVATTENGALVGSTDGAYWTPVGPERATGLRSVKYRNGTFVATGPAGKLLISPSGETWVTAQAPTSETLNQVSYGKGTWVAVGTRGTIATSVDLETWVLRTNIFQPRPRTNDLLVAIPADLRAVTYGANRFVAVGQYGTILVSSEGTRWTVVTSPTTSDLVCLTVGNGKFVAAANDGAVVQSVGGDVWSSLTMSLQAYGAAYHDIAFDGSRFIIVGHGWYANLLASGAKVENSTFVPAYFSGLAEAEDGVWVANGSVASPYSGSRPGELASLNGIAEGAGQIIAVGDDGTIRRSVDGATWETASSGVTENLTGVAGTRDVVVAVGNGGRVLSSTDGRTWVTRTSGTAAPLSGVAQGGGWFVAVGARGALVASTNGVDWEARPNFTTEDLSLVRYLQNQFWAVGSGKFWVSSDTRSWTAHQVPKASWLTDITFGDGMFAALDNHLLRRSAEGETWSEPASPIPSWGGTRVAYHAGGFASVMNSNEIRLSADGVNWYPRSLDVPYPIAAIEPIRGALYGVGAYGVIIRSQPAARLALVARPGGGVEARLHDGDSRPFRVEYCEGLGSEAIWRALPAAGTSDGPGSPVVWIDPAASGEGFRFYRAVSP